MPYRKTFPLLLALALLAAGARAQTAAKPFVPDAERVRAYVTYLASDKLEGRRTGTPGAAEAARYIADEFKRLGLAPGGSITFTTISGSPRATNSMTGTLPSYEQPFPYVAAVELGKGNALTVTRRVDATTGGTPLAIDFTLGEDWMPLGFSSNAKVEGAVVFVGYGITDAAQNYDDYKGADVAGKVAVALAGTPDGDSPHSRFTRAGELRFKAAAARAAGAAALVVVSGEENFKDERLARLRYDNSGGDAGLPVVVISRQAASKIPGVGEALRTRDASASSIKVPAGVMLSVATDVVRKNAPASNIVGVLEGSDEKLKNETIVIGAHYDHLGRGGEGSRAEREGEIHHGADDNASGTAGLLELARLLSNERALMRRTVVFVAFGGEEEGLVGSSFYVQHPARPLEQTVAMLNMDMIGRLREGALSVGGVGTASEWRGWIEEANKGFKVTLDPSITNKPDGAQAAGTANGDGDKSKSDDKNKKKSEGHDVGRGRVIGVGAGRETKEPAVPIVVNGSNGRTAVTAVPAERFTLRLSEDGYGPSDHSSFYARRVPVLFFFTGTHEDYHKPSDTADRINYDGEAQILQFVSDLVHRLQASDARPTYAQAKSEMNTHSATFRVSLGTMPSYAETSDGLLLEGVRDGSPAAAAGLKAGDKIVKLAGRDIRNVYDYTQALSEMKAGQEYDIELLRDGRRLALKITPVERK
ncbi:MAG TPA: M20/M25/M40 family metallo-hydrolase [Pyrinomonadaceae bacterium]|nr:M20/M25/M40 family metallo-hydrolase [Pyrinomonadaceae bacterium]